MTSLGSEMIEWYVADDQSSKVRLPLLGQVKVTQIMAFVLSVGILMAYEYQKYWWLSNIIALVLTLYLFRVDAGSEGGLDGFR